MVHSKDKDQKLSLKTPSFKIGEFQIVQDLLYYEKENQKNLIYLKLTRNM